MKSNYSSKLVPLWTVRPFSHSKDSALLGYRQSFCIKKTIFISKGCRKCSIPVDVPSVIEKGFEAFCPKRHVIIKKYSRLVASSSIWLYFISREASPGVRSRRHKNEERWFLPSRSSRQPWPSRLTTYLHIWQYLPIIHLPAPTPTRKL